jgi:thioredoxin 1
MAEEKNYITLNDENFEQEVIQSDIPVVVDFWAEWCGPCRVLGPVIEELADDFKGQVKVAKLNVDNSPKTAQKFAIRSIPTVLFFNGGNVVDSVIGSLPKPALAEKMTALTLAVIS